MNPDGTLHVGDRARAWEMYRRAVEIGAPQAPLYEAAARSHIRLLNFLHPQVKWPAALLAMRQVPTLLVINDDPGPDAPLPALGPKGWRCASRLGRWAEGVMIHGSGGKEEHYVHAVAATMLCMRVILVETASQHAQAWRAAIDCAATLMILPHDGAHPIDARTVH